MSFQGIAELKHCPARNLFMLSCYLYPVRLAQLFIPWFQCTGFIQELGLVPNIKIKQSILPQLPLNMCAYVQQLQFNYHIVPEHCAIWLCKQPQGIKPNFKLNLLLLRVTTATRSCAAQPEALCRWESWVMGVLMVVRLPAFLASTHESPVLWVTSKIAWSNLMKN